MYELKLVEVKAYVVHDSPTYEVIYKLGNKTIRRDSFDPGPRNSPNWLHDPINWVEDLSPIPVKRDIEATASYYFKDKNSIWVKVGHSMNVLTKYLKECF